MTVHPLCTVVGDMGESSSRPTDRPTDDRDLDMAGDDPENGETIEVPGLSDADRRQSVSMNYF